MQNIHEKQTDMNMITFLGVVVGRALNRDSVPEIAVCCVSRTDAKDWRVISLEGKFAESSPDFAIEAGMIAYGRAKLMKIWDGSLLVQFMKEDFQILPSDTIKDFHGRHLKYIHNPHAERMMTVAGKKFYRFRLDEIFYPHQLKWIPGQSPFGRFPLNMLAEDRKSMAVLNGSAILFAKTRLKYGKLDRKVGIFLLASATTLTHTPIFMLADADIREAWHKGGLYHFKELPILYSNDTLYASPAGEAESTLVCGKGRFSFVQNPDAKILAFFYDELGDVANMPEWLWHKYFGCKLDRASLGGWRSDVRARLELVSSQPMEKAHGWWYHWYDQTTLKISDTSQDGIIILVPGFTEGGPYRIIALPGNVYMTDRERFPEHAIAVSVSADPRIIEGRWVPDQQSWELIKKWVIYNEAALKQDSIFVGDLKSPD